MLLAVLRAVEHLAINHIVHGHICWENFQLEPELEAVGVAIDHIKKKNHGKGLKWVPLAANAYLCLFVGFCQWPPVEEKITLAIK